MCPPLDSLHVLTPGALGLLSYMDSSQAMAGDGREDEEDIGNVRGPGLQPSASLLLTSGSSHWARGGWQS